MSRRESWAGIRNRRLEEPETRAAYERARRAHELGETIRVRRERLHLSQRELTEKMRTTQSVIARLESGAVLPTLDTLERVADALGAELTIRFQTGRNKRPTRAVS